MNEIVYLQLSTCPLVHSYAVWLFSKASKLKMCLKRQRVRISAITSSAVGAMPLPNRGATTLE